MKRQLSLIGRSRVLVLALAFPALHIGQLHAQCGSTVLGTSGNPYPLTLGADASACASNSLPVPNPAATQQSNVTPLGCGASQQRDIWFIFTATSTTTVIDLYNNGSANMGFMIYDAPCADNMNLVACEGYAYPAAYATIKKAFLTVPGNEYYVRVSRLGSNTFSNNLHICGWSWVRPADEPFCEASFESGNTAGWQCRYGYYDLTWNFPNTGCLDPDGMDAPLIGADGIEQAIDGGNRHTVISDKLYLDPRTNFNVSGVAPKGGNYSFRLGNNSYGCGVPQTGSPFPTCPAQAESVRIPLAVTPDNAGFTYMFAAVILNPAHAAPENPRFETIITTQSGDTIPCGYFLFVADSGSVPFSAGVGNWQYTDWTEVGLDLTPFIGQTITIEFRVAGCYPPYIVGNNAGAHSAYVYVDAYCKPFGIGYQPFCAGQASLEICAPAGSINYSWPPQPGLVPPLNQQCVTVTNPIAGTVYNVNMQLITGCSTSTTVELAATQVTLVGGGVVCLENNEAVLEASVTGTALLPPGNELLYMLSEGAGLVIIDLSSTPSFTVAALGTHTIHSLVYDPTTLNLGSVVLGSTTVSDVNGLLIQGGGEICASLDVEGVAFNVAICTGVAERATATLSAYPNPADEALTVTTDLSGALVLQLFDLSGRQVFIDQRTVVAGQSVQVGLPDNIANGTYILRVSGVTGVREQRVAIGR